MDKPLNETERAILAGFLDRLSDIMGNAGCNDFTLPNTDEGLAIARAVADCDCDVSLLTYDHLVLRYIRDKIGI